MYLDANVAYVTWVDLLAKHVIPLQALALVYEALAETTATELNQAAFTPRLFTSLRSNWRMDLLKTTNQLTSGTARASFPASLGLATSCFRSLRPLCTSLLMFLARATIS